MIGTSAIGGDRGLGLVGAQAHHKRRGRDAAAHRHLIFATFPVFFAIAIARRVLRVSASDRTARRSIVEEAWIAASTASAFAFMG